MSWLRRIRVSLLRREDEMDDSKVNISITFAPGIISEKEEELICKIDSATTDVKLLTAFWEGMMLDLQKKVASV